VYHRDMRLRFIASMLFLSAGLTLPVACTSDAEDFCDAKCSCEFCSEFEYDRCLRDFDFNADNAERRGCYAFYDAYLACVDDFAICRGGDFDDGCGPERNRWKDCVKD
jgi:hypothetical protein